MLRITDDQGELIRKHFPDEHYPDDRPGPKPIAARKVLEAALWILNTGVQWHMLPQPYRNYKTVHRRFQQWCQNKVIRAALTNLANFLPEIKGKSTSRSATSMPRLPRPRAAASKSARLGVERS